VRVARWVHVARGDAGGTLLRYVLRPPVAQERVEQRPDGLVRITLKKAYSDGTIAVDMDPLSLLCRRATSVPPPRFHTLKYAGVLAPASLWRSRLAPTSPPPSRRRERRAG
jgi:Putative transposase